MRSLQPISIGRTLPHCVVIGLFPLSCVLGIESENSPGLRQQVDLLTWFPSHVRSTQQVSIECVFAIDVCLEVMQ